MQVSNGIPVDGSREKKGSCMKITPTERERERKKINAFVTETITGKSTMCHQQIVRVSLVKLSEELL